MGYYDDIAEGYEELHAEEQQNKISLIKLHFHPKKIQRLLDVGCGTGITTEPWECKRYGIDTASRLIERARKREAIEYKVAPAENIPYQNNFFDHVISITAIQNFSDIEKGLEEIRRVGKKSFVLTFLKRSEKRDIIDSLIRKNFIVDECIEEEKDLIYLCR